MRPRLILSLITLLALAACGESKKETGGKAAGEILPASVSDAMLPRDTVRSQLPLAPGAEDGEKGKDAKKDAKPEAKEPTKAEPASAPAKTEPAEPAD
jgi:hypothetical protein